MLAKSVHLLLAILGILFLYVAFFLKEDEEGRIENWVSTVWHEIDEKAKAAGGIFYSFSVKVAEIYLQVIDRIFGERTLSIQSIGMAIWLSLFSFYAGFAVIDIGTPVVYRELRTPFIYLTIVVVQSLFARRWLNWISLLLLCFEQVRWALFFSRLYGPPGATVWATTFVGGGIIDLFWLFANRAIAKWASKTASLTAVFSWLVCSALSVLAMKLNMAEAADSRFYNSLVLYLRVPATALVYNRLFTGGMSLLVLLVLLTLILHRVCWPFLSRAIYPLKRFGLFEHRKLMAALAG